MCGTEASQNLGVILEEVSKALHIGHECGASARGALRGLASLNICFEKAGAEQERLMLGLAGKQTEGADDRSCLGKLVVSREGGGEAG